MLDANWCIECGAAFILATSFIGDQSLELEQKSLGHPTVDAKLRTEHKPDKHSWDCVPFPGQSTVHDDPTGLLQQSPPGTTGVAVPKRYWESSKSYAWRKPCSKVEHTRCKSEEILLNATPVHAVHATTPVLNATPLQLDMAHQLKRVSNLHF